MNNLETAKRLRHDAELLRNYKTLLPNLKFDMETWGNHPKTHSPEEHNYCGTVACAAGTIALTGKSGLKANWKSEGEEQHLLFINSEDPAKADLEGDDAAVLYYGISGSEASTLFRTGWEATAKEKAQEMEDLAKFYEEGEGDNC